MKRFGFPYWAAFVLLGVGQDVEGDEPDRQRVRSRTPNEGTGYDSSQMAGCRAGTTLFVLATA